MSVKNPRFTSVHERGEEQQRETARDRLREHERRDAGRTGTLHAATAYRLARADPVGSVGAG